MKVVPEVCALSPECKKSLPVVEPVQQSFSISVLGKVAARGSWEAWWCKEREKTSKTHPKCANKSNNNKTK